MKKNIESSKRETADRELIVTRVLNAPRELVFKVWTDPKHVAKWWGPNGFTNTIYEMNVSVDGVFRFMMHGPDGTDYPNKIVYHEVKKPERLVYTHSDDIENSPNDFRVTVTFEEQGRKTLLTMHTVFKTAEALEAVKKFGAIEGGKQTLDRLEAYLVIMQ